MQYLLFFLIPQRIQTSSSCPHWQHLYQNHFNFIVRNCFLSMIEWKIRICYNVTTLLVRTFQICGQKRSSGKSWQLDCKLRQGFIPSKQGRFGWTQKSRCKLLIRMVKIYDMDIWTFMVMEDDRYSSVIFCYFYNLYPATMQKDAEKSQQDSYHCHWGSHISACTFGNWDHCTETGTTLTGRLLFCGDLTILLEFVN